MKTIKVWHFAGKTLRDGTALPDAGVRLPHIADPIPCERGYHGSERLIDALKYAPGSSLAVRLLSGTLKSHGNPVDKHFASDCTMETGYIDVSPVLIEFARFAALKAIREYAPKALRATGNPELITWADKLAAFKDDCDLKAARDAASDAARDAARYAASDAARYASYASDAARYASYAASYASDASDAARYASYASYASYAASEEFNTWLESRILPLFKGEK